MTSVAGARVPRHGRGAVAVAALAAALLLLATAMRVVSGTLDAGRLIMPLPFLSMAVVGAVLVRRRPGNAIGRLLLAVSTLMAVSAISLSYADLVAPAGLETPVGHLAAWLGAWLWAPTTMLLGVLFMVFPTGRPLSRPWAWVTRAVWVVIVATTVAAFGLLSADGAVLHPASLEDIPGATALALLANVGMLPVLVAAFAAIVVRYRRSVGVERQQMKSLAAAAALFATVTVFGGVLAAMGPGDPMDHGLYVAGLAASMISLPAAMAVAILRYRLYDIDRLLRRTASYALASGLVVGLYAGGVLTIGAAVRLVSAQASGDLAVAGSTLLAAAAFQPLHRRVRTTVDRRFDRPRLEAEQTVAALSSRLRDQVDVDALAGDVAAVVGATVRPVSVSLWLAPAGSFEAARP